MRRFRHEADLPVKNVATGRRGDDGAYDKPPASPFFIHSVATNTFNYDRGCSTIIVTEKVRLIFAPINPIICCLPIAVLSTQAGRGTRDYGNF